MSLGQLYKLARLRATLRRGVESPRLAKQSAALTAHTGIADYIANKKYKPEPNPITSDEQALLDKLVGGMSRSRARIVGARRKARGDVRAMLASSKLW